MRSRVSTGSGTYGTSVPDKSKITREYVSMKYDGIDTGPGEKLMKSER
jgi:hypothetical protein